MSAERVIQAAVYAALTGDATYAALVTGGVHDQSPPPGTAYPYTLLGEATETPDHVMEKDGWEHTLTVHDWDDREGRKRLQQIREARNDVLHRATLSVSGFGLTTIHYEFGEVLRDFDNDTQKQLRHQVTRYRLRSLATS